jgi:putative NADPH-quinone reductase
LIQIKNKQQGFFYSVWMKNILIIQGHPDAGNNHYCEVVAEKYISAATSAGHQSRILTVAAIEFPLLKSKAEFEETAVCDSIEAAQLDIMWADHVVVIYPLWLGDMPALLKGFWEQVLRPGFALSKRSPNESFTYLLAGKSARIFVTMGMPSNVYRWFFKAHSVKSLKRNVLKFCGFKPVKFTLIGGVGEANESHLKAELSNVSRLGRAAQ